MAGVISPRSNPPIRSIRGSRGVVGSYRSVMLPVSALAETSCTPPKPVSPRSSRAASSGAPRNPPIRSRARPGTTVCSGTIEIGIGMRSEPAASCALAGV